MEAYLTLAAFPDVRPGLEALKSRGVKLAILSNGEQRMLEAAAKSAGIDTLLDAIISVEAIKIFKVSPRVYQLGLERLQVDRTGLGFVSSNSWDINGAASAGLTTFRIQRTAGGARVRGESSRRGDYRAGTPRPRLVPGPAATGSRAQRALRPGARRS
jgi:2-haloacid dehalogenase